MLFDYGPLGWYVLVLAVVVAVTVYVAAVAIIL